jgi:thiol-disulfide isomerase/thioredoxin
MTKDRKNINQPEVLMFMGPQCGFCGPMIKILTELMKEGVLSDLRIIDIVNRQELAAEYGVRSVPWLQIGPFELLGSRSKQELKLWLERASSIDGVTEYLQEVLAEGKVDAARKLLQHKPEVLSNVVEMMADPDEKINIRLGLGVIIEEMAESDEFQAVTPKLVEYLSSEDARIRGDACHYLSLTNNRKFIPDIEVLLTDENEEVREIAQESLDELRDVR